MWSFIKKIGWRIAAIYYWIHFLAWILGFGIEAIQLERDLIHQLEKFLLSIGAAPVSPVFLPIVIKAGWFLFFTEFKPSQMIGFLFYLIFFPILLPFIIFFGIKEIMNRKSLEEIADEPAINKSDKKKNDESYFPFPVLTTFGFLLVAWFLIFGDTNSQIISYFGVFISGLLFLGFISRLFIKSSPVLNEKPVFFTLIEKPLAFPTYQIKQIKKKSYKTKEEIETDVKPLEWFQKVARIIILKLGRRNVQNKITFIVLGEFILSMIMMGTCAVIFWSLIIKSVSPSSLDILSCLQISASYFLPSLDKPNLSISLPYWIGIGASATAWIVFVLYLSPAGNLIPDRQKLYLKQLLMTRKTYRKRLFSVRNEIDILDEKKEILIEISQNTTLLKETN